jgi:hypothetical protein
MTAPGEFRHVRIPLRNRLNNPVVFDQRTLSAAFEVLKTTRISRL